MVPPSIPVPVLSAAVLPIGEPFAVVVSEIVVEVVLLSPQAASNAQSAAAGIILR
jgi:hypothetical protein